MIRVPYKNGVAVMGAEAYAESIVNARSCGCGDCLDCTVLAHSIEQEEREREYDAYEIMRNQETDD